MSSERFEQAYPLVIAVAVGAMSWLYFLHKVPTALHELLGAVVSVSSIAVGFLATAKSMLIAVDNKRAIQRLRDAGLYEPMLRQMMYAINASFVLAAVSAIGLLVDLNSRSRAIPAVGAGWFALLAYVALLYHQVVRMFAKILRNAQTVKS